MKILKNIKFLFLLIIIIFISCDGGKMNYDKKAEAYAFIAGKKLANCCSVEPVKIDVRYKGYSVMHNGRLKIEMTIHWENAMSECHFRMDGILRVDKKGCNPKFEKTFVDAPGILCIAIPYCEKMCELPECLD